MVMVLVTYYYRSTYKETAGYIVKRKHIHILITSSLFLPLSQHPVLRYTSYRSHVLSIRNTSTRKLFPVPFS